MFFQSQLYPATGGGINPFDGTGNASSNPTPELDFARRFGFARLATQQRDLKDVIANPAGQMQIVLAAYQTANNALTTQYKNYLAELRELNLPDEEVVFRADAYIRPEIARRMEMLKLKYPYSVGDAGGPGLNPIGAIEAGVGSATLAPGGKGNSGAGVDARRNWRIAKQAFKALKKARHS